MRITNSGKSDGEVGRIYGIDQKYKNLIMVPTPINKIESIVFTKNIELFEVSWKNLEPYTIAIRIGEKHAENGTKGMQVRAFATTEELFKLVAKDRFDICVTSRINGLLVKNKAIFKNIKMLEPPLEITNLYHYLHKKNKKLIPRINKVLLNMKKNGELETIRKEYIENM